MAVAPPARLAPLNAFQPQNVLEIVFAAALMVDFANRRPQEQQLRRQLLMAGGGGGPIQTGVFAHAGLL